MTPPKACLRLEDLGYEDLLWAWRFLASDEINEISTPDFIRFSRETCDRRTLVGSQVHSRVSKRIGWNPDDAFPSMRQSDDTTEDEM